MPRRRTIVAAYKYENQIYVRSTLKGCRTASDPVIVLRDRTCPVAQDTGCGKDTVFRLERAQRRGIFGVDNKRGGSDSLNTAVHFTFRVIFWEITGWDAFFDVSPLVQAHGPSAVQVVGLCVPEEKTVTMGVRKLSSEAAISLNEIGTCS